MRAKRITTIGWACGIILLSGGLLTASETGSPQGLEVRRNATVKAVDKALPSVVNIATENLVSQRDQFEEMLREFWDPFYQRRSPGTRYNLGSGVIIEQSGYILTNDHVVRRANRIWVKLVENGREYQAEVVARDAASDLAILKIGDSGDESFDAIEIAHAEDLILGETVLALGNPFGLGGSVSQGILSSKNRRPPQKKQGALDVDDWLQTDAAINPGNSGGPLINLNGELIGLNVAIFEQAEGIGFAVPTRRINESLSKIFTPETVANAWWGARVAAGYAPLEVLSVESGSPAAKAGLKEGDQIAAVAGKEFSHYISFVRKLTASEKKQPVDVTIERSGQRRTIEVTLEAEGSFFNAALIQERTGASLQPFTDELAREFGFRSGGGLLVAGVDEGTPAGKAGLEAGMIIEGIDGQRVDGITEAAKLIYKKRGANVVLDLLVQRRSDFRKVYTRERVKMPVQ